MTDLQRLGRLRAVGLGAQRLRRRSARAAIDPESDRVLDLQASAGNAAVSSMIASVQRDEKKAEAEKESPYIGEARKAMGELFPGDKKMKGVNLADYKTDKRLNEQVRGVGYGAWTESGKEIFVNDPADAVEGMTPNAAQGHVLMLVTLRHESVHIRQFGATGLPKTYEQMLKYELEAYKQTIDFIESGELEKVVVKSGTKWTKDLDPIADALKKSAEDNHDDLSDLLDDAKALKGKERDKKIRLGMEKLKLIPADSPADPAALYKLNKVK